MIVVNHQPQFLPYLGFFHKVAHADLLVLMDDVQFLERGFQHRNYIKMQAGKQWLTVPVQQRYGQLIRDVVIDATQNWRRKHWAALQTNYSKAPFWKQLSPELEEILVRGGQTTIFALDLELLKWAMRILGIATPIQIATDIKPSGQKTEYHISICKLVGASTYLSGAGGRLYMDLARFAEENIEVMFQTYVAREYRQLYPQHGFVPDLAVVDALFNVGPEARDLISAPIAP